MMFAYYNQGHVRVDWYYLTVTEVLTGIEREVKAGSANNYQSVARFRSRGKHGWTSKEQYWKPW